jgi:cellulose synthase/poly-beta-1,6-N-acetylglucosamine synthase-like glycosyltransferase
MLMHIIVSFCCLFSFLNLVFLVLIGNSLFRILSETRTPNRIKSEEKGLVDLKPTPTYDIRFRQ